MMRVLASIGALCVLSFIFLTALAAIDTINDRLRERRRRIRAHPIPDERWGRPDVEGDGSLVRLTCPGFATKWHRRYADAIEDWNNYAEGLY